MCRFARRFQGYPYGMTHDDGDQRIFSLTQLSDGRLEIARASTDRRSSVSLHQGEACVLRQTVTALLAGQRMDLEHPPDEAWILVIVGRISLHNLVEGSTVHGIPVGDLVQLPHGPHALLADEDSAVLLTVAKGSRPG